MTDTIAQPPEAAPNHLATAESYRLLLQIIPPLWKLL